MVQNVSSVGQSWVMGELRAERHWVGGGLGNGLLKAEGLGEAGRDAGGENI